MLKPFQIRDLYGPALQPDSSHPPSCGSSQVSRPGGGSDTAEFHKLDHGERSEELRTSNTSYGTSRPGIIQMTAHEYDEAVTGYPQNSLMYMDDDDGETVTVGSSFELSQRLNEPIDSSASLPSLTGNHSPSQTMSNPIHIFDIRRSRSTLDLWRGFEKRTVQSGIEGSSSPQSSVVGTLPTSSPCSPGVTNSYPDTDGSVLLATQVPQRDIQTDWLQACKPPRMSPKQSHTGSNTLSSENSSVHKPGQTDDYLSTKGSPMSHSGVDSVKSSCSITEEGKRQAQEAGARFRNWKGAPTSDATSNSSSPPLPNPWTSYTKSQARLDDPPSQVLSQNEPELKASPAAAEEDEPLLAAFEAQMSKIMEEHATAVKTLKETSADNTDNPNRGSSSTPSTPTEPFNSGSRPPPTPIDLLAQAVNNMVVGATRLSTDLSHQIPEIERHVSSASARIPDRVDGSLRTLGSHIQVLAKATQDASVATRRAAGRTRAADHRAIERAVAERLRGAAGDLNSIGSSIYSSLESSLGASRSNTRAQSSAETPGQQAESVETAADSKPETSDSSVPSNEADSSCPRGMAQDETQQTRGSQKPSVDSHHVSPDDLAPKPSTSQPTDPQQPLYETTPSDALPKCGPGLTVEGTTKSTLGYPGMSTQAKPPTCEHDRPNRRGRSRSPFSVTQSHPPIPWDRRRSSFMPWSNPNPYAPRRYGGWPHLPHFPHARGSFPPSNIRRPDPTESRSDFKEPTITPDTLFLGIPGSGVTEATIRNLLAEQGFLAKVHLPIDSKSGNHVGFAYLKFPSIYAARAAKEALQGAHLGGKAVNVEFSHDVNFDALQTRASLSNVLQPGNLAATRPTAPSALRRRPSLSLTNPDRNKNLKSKPSVTFADTDNTASATTNIKRYKSLGALPLASGGPFPYAKPTYPTSSNLLNKHHSLGKAGDARDDDVEYVRSEPDARNKSETHALLDQEDTDAEFSARYPSLLATRDLRRANTVTSATTQDSLPKPTTGLESDISRFPSLSQLEAQTFAQQHPKPTTTSAPHPPLSGRKPEARESNDLGNHLSLGSTASNKLPGSWPQETSETSKPDLLDQLHRVEGGDSAVKERSNILNRSNSLVSADPAARLSGPFNPDNERSWDGIGNFPKRSATERRPNRPWDHTIRSSRSHRGLGEGIATRDPMRQEPSWETYLGHPRNLPKITPLQANDVRPLHMNHPGMSQRTVPGPNVQENIMTSASESRDRSNSKIDACVEHLKALGFHNEGEDGEQRLKVYACAVDGNLGDAIEMIEEERKVYEQRPSLV